MVREARQQQQQQQQQQLSKPHLNPIKNSPKYLLALGVSPPAISPWKIINAFLKNESKMELLIWKLDIRYCVIIKSFGLSYCQHNDLEILTVENYIVP